MENSKKRKPPYVSDRVWEQFFRVLERINPPTRLAIEDITKMEMAPNQEGALSSAVIFLGLVEPDGTATPKMATLVGTKEARAAALKKIVQEAYTDLLDQYQIDKATMDDLRNYFAHNHSNASALKMVRSFLSLARRANWNIPALEEAKKGAKKAGVAPKQIKQQRLGDRTKKVKKEASELKGLTRSTIGIRPGTAWYIFHDPDYSEEDVDLFIQLAGIFLKANVKENQAT